MTPALIGLGANQGDSVGQILAALSRLHRQGAAVRRASSLYRTEPVGYSEQPWFVNAAALVETDLEAEALLQLGHALEEEFQRRRTIPNGPRTLDVDLLFFGDAVLSHPAVPHPRLRERAFVLRPCAEIAPDWPDPRDGRTLGDLARQADRNPSQGAVVILPEYPRHAVEAAIHQADPSG